MRINNNQCIYLQVLVAVRLLDSHVYARSSKILDGRLVACHLFALLHPLNISQFIYLQVGRFK